LKNKTVDVLEHTVETEKAALAKRTIHTLISYAFYDLRSGNRGNREGPILATPRPAPARSITLVVPLVWTGKEK